MNSEVGSRVGGAAVGRGGESWFCLGVFLTIFPSVALLSVQYRANNCCGTVWSEVQQAGGRGK